MGWKFDLTRCALNGSRRIDLTDAFYWLLGLALLIFSAWVSIINRTDNGVRFTSSVGPVGSKPGAGSVR